MNVLFGDKINQLRAEKTTHLSNICVNTECLGTMVKYYSDVIMGEIAFQITSLIVYLTVYSDADQTKRQSSASRAFVRGIHWGPVNSPHKRPVTRKMFPFNDVIMSNGILI